MNWNRTLDPIDNAPLPSKQNIMFTKIIGGIVFAHTLGWLARNKRENPSRLVVSSGAPLLFFNCLPHWLLSYYIYVDWLGFRFHGNCEFAEWITVANYSSRRWINSNLFNDFPKTSIYQLCNAQDNAVDGDHNLRLWILVRHHMWMNDFQSKINLIWIKAIAGKFRINYS